MNSEFALNISKSLSDKLGQNVEIKAARSIGGGCIHSASLLETSAGNFFLKWNSTGPTDIFVREAESLTELRKASQGYLAIPVVFAVKAIDATPGFLVLEYLPTNSARNSDEKLGKGLALIHQYSSDRFGFYNNNYCGETTQDNRWNDNWHDFFIQNRIKYLLGLIQKRSALPVHEIKIYEHLLDRIPQLIPEKSTPVLIHGDLWSGNYMNTETGPALIDPACYYADREMEFGIITMFGGFSSRLFEAYNSINPLPAEWRERNLLYQLYHVLNHYYLFGGGYQSQAIGIAKSYL
ncbi:MAG: fructosamine kinase family protein [Prolixibacteraceae bacterium]|nr:fructosamine kinase family protein [Prolixibacteraceae bacterium]